MPRNITGARSVAESSSNKAQSRFNLCIANVRSTANFAALLPQSMGVSAVAFYATLAKFRDKRVVSQTNLFRLYAMIDLGNNRTSLNRVSLSMPQSR